MAFPSSGLFVATFVDAHDTTQLALDLDLETHKGALFTDSVTGANLTSDTAYGVSPWDTNEVANGNGYTTGGNAITTTTFTHSAGGVVNWDAADMQWTSATFTCRGVLVYADALVGNNGIAAVNFGADKSPDNGTLDVVWDSGGIFSIDYNP